MLCRLLTTLLLAAVTGRVSAADFYLWQREHTPGVRRAVKEFHRLDRGRLLYLAGEIENNGKIIRVPVPEYLVKGASCAVIRIHVMEIRRSTAQTLAEKAAGIFKVWRDAGCDELQIDLDAPERRIAYYTQLMRELKKLLPPGTKLSATVLPCHLDHKKEFARLAASVDYFVLQLHYVQKKNGCTVLFDRDSACRAIAKAEKFRLPFKAALPLYTQMIKGKFIMSDWQQVADCSRFCSERNIPVIGFRLGNTGDRRAFDLETARSILNGETFTPRLELSWQRDNSDTFILYVKNCGLLYLRAKADCLWQNDMTIRDFDTLNGTLSDGSPEIKQLDILLPFPGEKHPVLWLKTSGNGIPELKLNIISKEQ